MGIERKKPERKPKSVGEAVGFQNIFDNKKADFLLGAILSAIALYVIVAITNCFYTGQADQSILGDLRPRERMSADHTFSNYCESIGTIIAYTLITVNFGIPAFLIPLFVILLELSLMRVYKINLWKQFLGMTFVMIWSSVTLTKFATSLMGEFVFNPDGRHGMFCVQQLESLVGPPGLTAILLLVALAFLTCLSTETIGVIRKALNPVKYLTHKVPFTVTNLTRYDNTTSVVKSEEEGETQTINSTSSTDADNSKPAVVDLTNVSKLTSTSTKRSSGKTVSTQPSSEDGASHLTVEVTAEDEKTSGKTLTVEEVLRTPINPRESFLKYKCPGLNLLKKYESDNKPLADINEIKANSARIVEVLNSFGVSIRKIKATAGPTIILYETTPAEGVCTFRIRNLEGDIALSFAALGIRVIALVPGKDTIGIEVPNKKPTIVSMENILNSKKFQESTMELPLAIGKTIASEVFMVDLAKVPHLLVADATGQGKSTRLDAIITSLLYEKHPNGLKIVLIDPKKVEFSVYSPITDHFMTSAPDNGDEPIITDMTKAVRTLNSLCTLMDHRYDMLKIVGARNIKGYNKKFINHQLNLTKGHEYMPHIAVVIDEYGDLIMTAGREVEAPITRTAQSVRAVGIHMIVAIQRPTASIITGNTRASFPDRVAFKMSTMVGSRTILNRPGAGQLVGRGDLFFLSGSEPVRVQCAFADIPEIERINQFIASQPDPVPPLELPGPAVDGKTGNGGAGGSDIQSLNPFFEEATHAIITDQIGSASMIQRRFPIGHNRAGGLMDQLEAAGVVGPAQGSKPRDMLVQDEASLNSITAVIRPT